MPLAFAFGFSSSDSDSESSVLLSFAFLPFALAFALAYRAPSMSIFSVQTVSSYLFLRLRDDLLRGDRLGSETLRGRRRRLLRRSGLDGLFVGFLLSCLGHGDDVGTGQRREAEREEQRKEAREEETCTRQILQRW